VNHELVAETSKVTVASIMLLASSPSRLKDLKCERDKGGSATLAWTANPEKGVSGYVVAWGPPTDPYKTQMRVPRPTATIPPIKPGTVVSVKAVNTRGLEGWDWAKVTIK
jgi:hypothetical protein